ncbi:MAG: DUF3046 domain-containing protein [Segniliparus sp.]|uniref:DUF3046 domain-containing protein n=1 Tax=Segniliparus sp. TaxID=2804064 RepID=UPI003F3993D0
MRLREFHARVREEFGPQFGESLLRDHALLAFGGATARAAIEKGAEPKLVWRALCADFDVPRVRW